MPKKADQTSTLAQGLDLDDPGAWVNVAQLPVLYPALWASPAAVRWDLRNRSSTGLAPFVRILGRKTIAHHAAAARWKLATAQATDPRYAR